MSKARVNGGEIRTRPRKLYRYKPVPPFAVDEDGYPCEDSMSQDSNHIAVFGYGPALKRHLNQGPRRRAFRDIRSIAETVPRSMNR